MNEIARGQGGDIPNFKTPPTVVTPAHLPEQHAATLASSLPVTSEVGVVSVQDEGVFEEGVRAVNVMELSRKVAEAVEIKGLLELNSEEVDNLLKALKGSYVKPGVGGEMWGVRGAVICCNALPVVKCFSFRVKQG